MSDMIERDVGINRKGDARHVDSLMAAGGFGHRGPRPEPAPWAPPAPGASLPAASTLRDGGVLKPVKALREKEFARKLVRSPIPPTPKVAWIRLDDLVIDDSYQRGVTEQGTRLIRRMVEDWDWARFKPLSVAATPGGKYEVVDGQHSAIAGLVAQLGRDHLDQARPGGGAGRLHRLGQRLAGHQAAAEQGVGLQRRALGVDPDEGRRPQRLAGQRQHQARQALDRPVGGGGCRPGPANTPPRASTSAPA